jgi:hypothetical protein
VETGSTLQIALGTNETAGIVSQGSSYALSLSGGTWSGPDSANVTGDGSAALMVTSAGLSTFTQISIVDTGGGDRVDFNDCGTNAYITSLAVGLTHSSAGIYFSGTSTFSGTASLSASTDCYCLLDAANLSMAEGDLSLTGTGAVAGVNCSIDVIQSQITTSATRRTNASPARKRPRSMGRAAGCDRFLGCHVLRLELQENRLLLAVGANIPNSTLADLPANAQSAIPSSSAIGQEQSAYYAAFGTDDVSLANPATMNVEGALPPHMGAVRQARKTSIQSSPTSVSGGVS